MVVPAGEDLSLEGGFALVRVPGGRGDRPLALDGAQEVLVTVDAVLQGDLVRVVLEVVADGARGDAELLGDGGGAVALTVEREGAVPASDGVGVGKSIAGVGRGLTPGPSPRGERGERLLLAGEGRMDQPAGRRATPRRCPTLARGLRASMP